MAEYLQNLLRQDKWPISPELLYNLSRNFLCGIIWWYVQVKISNVEYTLYSFCGDNGDFQTLVIHILTQCKVRGFILEKKIIAVLVRFNIKYTKSFDVGKMEFMTVILNTILFPSTASKNVNVIHWKYIASMMIL